MKTLPVLLLLMLLSCNAAMDKENPSGVYVRSFKNEYAIGRDTLRLEEITETSYRITKSSAYQRIMDGRMQADTQYHTRHWMGIYDKKHKLLNVRPSGKVMSIDFDKREIILGNTIYQRVKIK